MSNILTYIKNYGELSNYLQKMFPGNISDRKRAGECRQMFQHKELDRFELLEVEERACALSKVVVKVFWTNCEDKKESILTFGCVYESNTNSVAVPWRNNGKWVIMPWDVKELFR